ncbi:MAG: hypothetical protein P0Y49_13345 [Candidatus Pedobacter colombiensis]|uniref:Uncharacterized protein n=1 Tax=Candidatus Pedobacter colombiensis TaxID=3121371 RepID=A0AAJ5W3E9_9SPHI|nr:hypothetical protein [Pedobacter sp.]WEK17783.1 MAG: hypothetical protein P0Y49_13345 [Pedobacter sp.]
MDRKKKKQLANKSAANVELQRRALKDRFLDRVKKVVLQIGNEALLEKFPAIYFEKLYECRYTVLKAKAAPGSDIPRNRVIQFNKLLQQLMDGIEVIFPNGNKIPISWYLSEGMTLADCISGIETYDDPKLEEIKASFAFCSHDGKFHHHLQETLIDLVTDTCTLLSDYNDHIYRADLSMTSYFAKLSSQNDIIIYTFKPKKEMIETKKGTRSAIRLGWPSSEFEWKYFNVKPSLLGFKTQGLDIPLEIYIGTHTLERLQKRINITPGLMHQILLLTFLEPRIPHRWDGDKTYVDFMVSDQKVGYLVVKLHGSKMMIHTFLFLTNNDTLEGEKLGRLLNIVKEDKKYLEIDSLPAFNSYHIDKNEELSKLFKDAGCGSLLKLGHLEEFTANQIADKDPESILHYLADAPYFSKEVSINDRDLSI